MVKSDSHLKRDIETELRWDPKVNAAQIGVSVDKGAVTLFGALDTYPQKWAAEEAAKRVSGVRALAQDLTVKLQSEHARTDSEIAAAVLSALKWDVFVPNSVTAKVEDGAVTLEGQTTWNYQREAAERVVSHLAGVVMVHNHLSLKAVTTATEIKEKVDAALLRQATADGQSIRVDLTGGKVTLSGHASSWHAAEEAQNAAWAVLGVTDVVDELKIVAT